MKKMTLVAILAGACSLLGLSPAHADALDTDEAVAAAYEAATGQTMDKRHRCIQRSTTFKVVAVGGFAHDRGCMLSGYFVGDTWITDPAQAARAGLTLGGWDLASEEDRKKLAKAWVLEVVYAFDGSPVKYKAPSAFLLKKVPFEPPTAVAKDGVITVSTWITEPAGMVWKSSYYKFTATFAPDLAVSFQTSDHFSVSGETLKAFEEAQKKKVP